MLHISIITDAIEGGTTSCPPEHAAEPSTARRRIELTDEERAGDYRAIMERYGVSRTTAWRARQTGWLWQNYREYELVPAARPLDAQQTEDILRAARIGSRVAVRRLMDCTAFDSVGAFLAPLTLDDLQQAAAVRLLELAGHARAGEETWRIFVAVNASMREIGKHAARHREAILRLRAIADALHSPE